jgi:hypothetical protein
LPESDTVSKNNDLAGVTVKTDMTQGESANSPAFYMHKCIGSTAYEVEVRFNSASRETLDEKILRLIRNEAAKEQT